MQQYRNKQEIIDAEQFLGGTTLLGEEIIEHQCDYRMCDLCGGDNQKHLVVSNTNIIITQGNWLVRFPEGNRLSYYSNEAFERLFEPVSAPSDEKDIRNLKSIVKQWEMLFNPLIEYSNNHPEIKIGRSTTQFVLERAKKYDEFKPQSEGGLQWVKGAPNREQQFYAKFRTVGDQIKSGLIWPYPDSEPRMWCTQTKDSFCPIMDSDIIEYLDESASPSTANTGEGADKEKQIFFAEWATDTGWIYSKREKFWWRYPDQKENTSELYNLFLTETKQQ